MTASLKLDSNLLGHQTPPGVFIHVDAGLERRLGAMPETAERLGACVHFCGLLGHQDMEVPKDLGADARGRQKYLRAALAEYVSMEEASRIDLQQVHSTPEPPKIVDLPSPHLHVVRLLRHANVHLSASLLSRDSRSAAWDGPDGRVEFEHVHYVVVNLSQTMRRTDGARRYAASDLRATIQWLDSEQREWGIANVILRAAEVYGFALADHWDRVRSRHGVP